MKQSRYIQDEEKSNIINDFKEGLNTVELGNKYNRNSATIGKLLKRNGYSARGKKKKLTDEQIKEAYSKYELDFLTTEELAEEYNVSERTIANNFNSLNLKLRPSGTIPDSGNVDFFETIDSEAKAYYLGFIMCDGSIIRGRYTKFLSIEIQERDRKLLEDFCDVIGITKERIKSYSRKGSDTCRVDIHSDKLTDDLIDKGVKIDKIGNKQFPLDVPDNLMKDMLRGLFDADGSIYESKIVLYGKGIMINQVSDYLYETLDLEVKPVVRDYSEYTPRVYIGKKDYNTVIDFLYRDSKYYLKRKNPFV